MTYKKLIRRKEVEWVEATHLVETSGYIESWNLFSPSPQNKFIDVQRVSQRKIEIAVLGPSKVSWGLPAGACFRPPPPGDLWPACQPAARTSPPPSSRALCRWDSAGSWVPTELLWGLATGTVAPPLVAARGAVGVGALPAAPGTPPRSFTLILTAFPVPLGAGSAFCGRTALPRAAVRQLGGLPVFSE